jgi:hypothetical protein
MVHLAGHKRPHEVLFASDMDIARAYGHAFVSITEQPLAGSVRLTPGFPTACSPRSAAVHLDKCGDVKHGKNAYPAFQQVSRSV